MRSFKWHGIPVNLPSNKWEWGALGVLEIVIAIIVIMSVIAR